MNNYRFERSARRNRRKALYATILFHLVLIGGLAYATSGASLEKILPVKVKEALGMEQPAQPRAQDRDLPRP